MIARARSLATLALAFSRVERVTRHEDGIRPETDADHSIMLALVACDLAPLGLNRGRLALVLAVALPVAVARRLWWLVRR